MSLAMFASSSSKRRHHRIEGVNEVNPKDIYYVSGVLFYHDVLDDLQIRSLIPVVPNSSPDAIFVKLVEHSFSLIFVDPGSDGHFSRI